LNQGKGLAPGEATVSAMPCKALLGAAAESFGKHADAVHKGIR